MVEDYGVTPTVTTVVTSRFTAAAIGAFTLAGGLACLAVVAGTDVVLDHRGLALLALENAGTLRRLEDGRWRLPEQ